MSIILIHPYPGRPEADVRLSGILSHALADREGRTIRTAEELDLRPGDRVLFALALDGAGQNLEYYRMLSRLRREPDLLEGCTAALIVDGPGELYTKSTAGELALAADMAGCALIGRPLVEGTGSLANFRVQAKNLGTDLMGAYLAAAQELVQRLDTFTFPQKERPELLVLHASSHHTSNTMALWAGVRERLGEVCSVQEIGLRNGTLDDCSGCPYTMCIHFGEKGECFYGGVMSREVYPAVRRADGVVMLCPNYNDALSANLTAFINRLTALFRQTRFYDKALFALVVARPIIHLRGDYLLIVTIGIVEIVRIALINDVGGLTGGSNGIFGISRPVFFGFRIFKPLHFYYLVWGMVGVSLLLFYGLWRSRIGRALNCIKEDDVAAEGCGINVTHYKLMAFVLGAFWAGMAGTLYAAKMTTIAPESFNFMESVIIFAVVILSGGSQLGVLVSAFLFIGLPELLREFSGARMLIFGLAMMLMMIWRPQGLMPPKSRRYGVAALLEAIKARACAAADGNAVRLADDARTAEKEGGRA